jgi:4,5-DOPA dioxygenase extradiol
MACEQILADDPAPLIEYEKLGREALLSIPTPDHHLPLLYVLGARLQEDRVTFPVRGIDGGSISILTVLLGT